MPRFLKVIIVLFLLFNVLFFGFVFYPVPKLLRDLKSEETVKVYDRYGELLYEVLDDQKGRQTYVSLSDIPTHLKNAFLSAEDQRFYEHSGVDLTAILRAVWQNLSAGKIVSGGSTITQQVVRNVIGINKERTFAQKAKETILAIKITKFIDKDEIFEVYLNSIYFGGLAYGVEAASWQYFNKSVVNLDLAESGFLAGLPQAPNRYYPFKHFERAKERQEAVLGAMLANSKITVSEFQQAFHELITLRSGSRAKRAPHFVDFVLVSNCGAALPAGRQGSRGANCGADSDSGQIITTLDAGLQERVDTILASDLTFLSYLNIENGAVVILEAETGDILAMVGSKDYDNEAIDGQVNNTTSLRQPGSSFKPLVYASAIEKGWEADTIIIDEPVRFETAEGLPYSPKNFDLVYHGEVTLAEALAQSLNVPAVKTLDFVGVGPFLSIVQSFGITSLTESPDHYGLALALGSGEVSLLELTNAYRVFSNNGYYSDYQLLKSGDKVAPIEIIQPATASVLSAILSNNDLRLPAFGEENPLNFDYPVAAKTGTTRDFKDNWTIGYTDDYVVGVWVGNADGAVMQGVSGISGAGPIFYKIMNMLHESTGTYLTLDPQINIPVVRTGFVESALASTSSEFRILSPFANDVFMIDPTKPVDYQKIKLEASEPAIWYVDDELVGEGKSVLWILKKGRHDVQAFSGDEERFVGIMVR